MGLHTASRHGGVRSPTTPSGSLRCWKRHVDSEPIQQVQHHIHPASCADLGEISDELSNRGGYFRQLANRQVEQFPENTVTVSFGDFEEPSAEIPFKVKVDMARHAREVDVRGISKQL